jgi:hypothetical protein
MTLVLQGGPHSHCHFQWEKPKGASPPKEIRLPGPDVHTAVVYKLTGRKKGSCVYTKSEVTWDAPPRLVQFVEYKDDDSR